MQIEKIWMLFTTEVSSCGGVINMDQNKRCMNVKIVWHKLVFRFGLLQMWPFFYLTFIPIVLYGQEIACPVLNGSLCFCEYGDIRCNRLSYIPRFIDNGFIYRSLDFSDQGIQYVYEASFFHLKVKRIWLESNPIGDNLHVNALEAAENMLEELSLANCLIPSLHQRLFMGMGRLRRLHLWGNELKVIPSGLFIGTPNLEELLLWGNQLDKIDQNMFDGLIRLRRLDLDRNRISEIKNDTFRSLPRLEVLHIGENRLFAVHSYTFTHLGNLKVLNMDNNGLTYLFPGAFSGLYGILSLGLQNNEISIVPDGTFRDMGNLNTLMLQNNNIHLVWYRTFEGLSMLKKLYLGANNIDNLPKGVFQQTHKLKHLSLDHNQLQTVDKCVFSSHIRLKTLSLIGNPVRCNCSLGWILDMVDQGVVLWGTCAHSAAQTLLSVTHPASYLAMKCSFAFDNCEFKLS